MISSKNYELVKWFDIDLGNCRVVSSSLGELTLSFNFLVFWIWVEYERVGKKP